MSRTNACYSIKVTYRCYYAFVRRRNICHFCGRKALENLPAGSSAHPYLGASIEAMLKDHRASVFLALTVALTITVTWRA